MLDSVGGGKWGEGEEEGERTQRPSTHMTVTHSQKIEYVVKCRPSLSIKYSNCTALNDNYCSQSGAACPNLQRQACNTLPPALTLSCSSSMEGKMEGIGAFCKVLREVVDFLPLTLRKTCLLPEDTC